MPCLMLVTFQCAMHHHRTTAVVWWLAGIRLACESFCWAWLSYSRGATAAGAAAALRLPWHCAVRSAGHGLLAFSGSGPGDPTRGRQRHCGALRPQPTPGYRPTDQALLLQLGCFTRSGVPPARASQSSLAQSPGMAPSLSPSNRYPYLRSTMLGKLAYPSFTLLGRKCPLLVNASWSRFIISQYTRLCSSSTLLAM